MDFSHSQARHIIFLDIETVSGEERLDGLNPRLQALWEKKSISINKDDQPTNEFYFNRAAIYAEFGRVISIGHGFIYMDSENRPSIKVRSISGHDEKKVLQEFAEFLTLRNKSGNLILCAHNGKEFDFPYLARRMLVNGIKVPEVLQTSGKKPWEVRHLDTMHMWKFGDWKSYTSLDLLAALFDIPTSKDGIDGSMVNDVYYKEKDLARIDHYCQRDVAVTAQLFLRLKGLPLVAEENITYLESEF